MKDQNVDERVWAAEKRDFIADRRDDIAAERDVDADRRDAVADEREALADARELELDERERRLDARAEEQGSRISNGDRPEAERTRQQRTQSRHDREDARVAREHQKVERETAEAKRNDETKRRQATTPTTNLAMAFAEIARYLFEADSFDDVLTRIVNTAVSTIAGGDMASITVRNPDGTYETVASTQCSATDADRAQYETLEGPCLDALEEAVIRTASFPDPRWPKLASRPSDSGVQAAISFRLTAAGEVRDQFLGSLNNYAGVPNAFDDEAEEIGFILACHASIATRAVSERDALGQLERQIHSALSSRDVIGQAKGILMERLRLTPEEAFDTLRRSSQHLNRKLRDLARQLAETGELEKLDSD